MSSYTWVITKDAIVGEASEVVGRIGPSGATGRLPFSEVIQQGEQFRLLNPWGRVEFSGFILGEYQGLEPLKDFGEEQGCVDIQYLRDGDWVNVE